MINTILKNTKNIWFFPCVFIGLLVMANVTFDYYETSLTEAFYFIPNLKILEHCLYNLFLACAQYWLITRVIQYISTYLANSVSQRHETSLIILPFIISVLKMLFFLILLNSLSQKLILPESFSELIDKFCSILIICSISAILFKVITVSEQLILKRSKTKLTGIHAARKIYTQTLIFKRVAYGIVSIITLGAILMLFDNVRTIGASVLTTAGILSLVLTFTAQRSLGGIFAGLEIALRQPIKIRDKIQIENKEGIVEEVNFRNVILKLGDGSYFSVPTHFFLEKPFQNWNHVEDANYQGSTCIFLDYKAPINEIRNYLQEILKQSIYWDQKVGRLQVSDLREDVIELKITASSQAIDDLSELLADIRESLVYYIVAHFPDALPRARCKFYLTK